MTEETPTGMRLDDVGIHAMSVMEDGRTVGLVVTEQQLGPATEPTLADLREALTAVYGTDFGIHDPTWISRFTDATRQATAYRSGRVLLAGDAAHSHPPTGGQGIGLGVQDAVNLGWKLAQVVRGVSPDGLLDTYQAERHPATARVLKNVMVQALLQRGDARTEAMRDTISDLLGFEGPRAQLAGLLSGLDVDYDLGEGHPLLGRRMPDLDLMTPTAPDESSSCSTTPDRCCSTSARPVASTSRPGRTVSSSSMPTTPGPGSCPSSAPSPPPKPC